MPLPWPKKAANNTSKTEAADRATHSNPTPSISNASRKGKSCKGQNFKGVSGQVKKKQAPSKETSTFLGEGTSQDSSQMDAAEAPIYPVNTKNRGLNPQIQ